MLRTIQQYIDHHATTEATSVLSTLLPQLQKHKLRYHSALCIPAYAEDEPLEDVWQNTLSDVDIDQHLVIVFGNWPDNASEDNKATTRASLDRLQQIHQQEAAKSSRDLLLRETTFQAEHIEHTGPGKQAESHQGSENTTHTHASQSPDNITWVLLPGSPSLLLLRSEQGLNRKKGVGLARKIAMDICVGLFQEKRLKNHWVGTTDADAILPQHYWSSLRSTQPPGLLVFPFEHRFHDKRMHEPTTQPLIFAHQIYQAYLDQYVFELHQAMPEFAFHTIGSIYAIHILSYSQVRGYPTLAAGEDFYLLNKIVKTGCVSQLSGQPILLRPRFSQRTPFGTGPSIFSLLENTQVEKAALFYDQDCIRLWQESLRSLRNFDAPQHWSALIPENIRLKLQKQYEQCVTRTQKRKALISIMDGLRCQQLLRSIHADIRKRSWRDYSATQDETTDLLRKKLRDGWPSHTSSSSQRGLSVEY